VIIIAEDGNARVTEFDFCNVLSSVPPPRRGSASMPFLAFPAPLALAPYVPHERFEVHPVRPGNDVYSMGVLLALLATGRHPLLPAGISFDEFGSIEMETWEQLHEQAPHIDCEESLKAVILSCIAQAGERRFGSFGELADALRSAYQRFTGSRYVSLPLLPETSDRLYNAMVTWDYLLAGQKAFDCVQAAMRLDPFSSAVLNDMGTLHDNTGRPTSALYYYRKTILLHGEYTPLAWNNIGTICQARRRHHEAIICFEQAIRIDPGYANAWCNKGHSHKSLGQTDEALACYDRAMQIDPHHLSAVHSSVQLLRSSGRQSEILPMFARLVERCPNYAPLRLVMAEELCHGEQWSEAIEMASSVLTADSSQYAAHMVLAYAYKKMDLRDGAISAIRAYHESASADEWRLVPEELRTLIEG
jgi:tetratricopeptide (TPR) repeat protein